MNILPNHLVLLDDKLQRAGALSRLDTMGAIAGHVLSEHDYDKLIVTHKDTVADALREAGVIARGSSLFHLRTKLAIDVLFAEVEEGNGTFRRFVIVEDKLFRNPEARREVLGQLLDYAKVLRGTDFERFSELLPDDCRAWLDANDYLVSRALRDADFLLLVCGDRIQPRLIDYVKHLKEQLDPLISADVALMSIAIFSDGSQHVLIPYVVALVTAEKGITIKVVVQGAAGKTQVSMLEESPDDKRRQRIEVEALLNAILKVGGEEAVSVAKKLFAYAQELGAEIRPAGASVSVRVRAPATDRRCTLFVVTRKATFYIGWLDSWATYADISPEVASAYRKRLTEIFGRSPVEAGTGGTYAIPLASVGAHLDEVLNEIRIAINALRHAGP